MDEHHGSNLLMPQLLGWSLLAGMVASLVLLAIWWNKPKKALVLGIALTLFQAFHTFEHVLQVRQWFSAPWQQGWMSPTAHNASVGLAYIADGVGITGTGIGMELLHLVGNALFFTGVLALWRAGLGGLSLVLIVFEGVHLLEHATLTATAAGGLPPWGASTFFGQLSGAELSTYRVWWHLVMNAAAFALAVAVLARARWRPPWVVAGGVCVALTALPVAYALTTPGQPGYSQIDTIMRSPSGWIALILSPVAVTLLAAFTMQAWTSRKGHRSGADMLPRTARATETLVLGMVAAVAVTATCVSFLAIPPRALSAQEPPGWPAGTPEASLDGAIAALSRAAFDGMVTLPVVARVGGWSARAYEDAVAQTGGDTKAGVVAFSEVAAELLANPGLQHTVRLPAIDVSGASRDKGLQVARQVLSQARQDGYLDAGPEVPDTATSREWRWTGGLFGRDSGEEPQWGSLSTIFPVSSACEVAAPQLEGDVDTYITQQRDLAAQYVNDPAVMALVFYWAGQESIIRSEPWQAWIRVAQDNLPWAGGDSRRDAALVRVLKDMHHAVIYAWKGKWTWQVTSFPDRAAPDDIALRLLPLTPLTPAYPDEVSALGGVVAANLEQANVGRVRVEMPGKLTAAPRTRVLPSPTALLDEVGTALQLAGLRSAQDTREGARLGRCLAGGPP